MMRLLNDIRQNKSLDEILSNHSFGMVYRVVKMYEVNGKTSDKSMRKPAHILLNEIKEQYPIDKFPEKYI
jgi:hypothetical protein